MLRNPLFFKILMISLLALILLIPLGMIQSKISERQMLQNHVQQDIARSASGPQTITGPYLVLRYKLIERRTDKDSFGNEKVVTSSSMQDTVVMARNLSIVGDADVETRSRGIYKARLFNLHSKLTGDFVVPQGYGINSPVGDITPVAAYFVMQVSDSRGIRNAPVLTLNGTVREFAPGAVGPIAGNGIHVPLPALNAAQSHTFNFDFPLELQGMTTLAVSPSGNNTEMSLKSSWPHPSFGGSYLPLTRTVEKDGFSAQWLVTNLARNSTAQDENGHGHFAETFSVDFIDPVNIYLLSERAVKYGVLFVVLVFTSFFMFEVLRSLRIHPMQYLLVGLAMAMFFLLIISLSEHMPFLASYVISGAACAALIGIYLAGVLQNRKPGLAFAGGIALLYVVLYGVLQSEDNALLMGTLVMFSALAAVMVLTRRMDWYRLNVSDNSN
ncbi:MAG: cell envelope integrity protein CreD [Sideroxyarcus sp.]|nr:cell envelope integrity protein CreD [Sideroxyarcus sp.]